VISDPLHIACAADVRYAPHCAAMLHSALVHSGPVVHVHFLHDATLPTNAFEKLRATCEQADAIFDPVLVDPAQLRGLHAAGNYAKPAWFRCLLPTLRPGLERVLYLDCDVIVMQPLQPLWDTPLAGALVAAVRNVTEDHLAAGHRDFGLADSHHYFNSGVLLMDLAGVRRDGIVARILEHGRRHGTAVRWADQDSLNHAFQGRCHYLHPRWNCQNSLFFWPAARAVFGDAAVEEATRQPAILHFEGPGHAKPWHYLNRHPLRAEYWRHARATPFPAVRPEGRTLRNLLGRLLGIGP
jgi:lipopolysaccharide biosynthesis glycosyltransferase